MIDVRRMITDSFNSMSWANQCIANVILSNFDHIHEFSVSQVARTANVSPAMVVKFSKRFGFSGFDELKYAVKYFNLSTDSNIEKIANAIFISYSKNYDLVGDVADAVHAAERVFILGQANSANIAYDFFFRLSKIRSNVFLAREREEQRQAIFSAKEGDVLLLVSNSGNCRELLEILQQVDPECTLRNQTILVSNNEKARLRPYAHLCMFGQLSDTEEYSQHLPFANKYSLMFLLDMIFFDILNEHQDESIEMLNRWRLRIRS